MQFLYGMFFIQGPG